MIDGFPCAFENIDGILEENVTGAVQAYPLRLAVEESDAKLVFKGFYLLPERRLLDAEPFSGAGDAAFFRHGNKIAQVSKFHHFPPNYS